MEEEKKEDVESVHEEAENEAAKSAKQEKDGIKYGKWSRDEHKELLQCILPFRSHSFDKKWEELAADSEGDTASHFASNTGANQADLQQNRKRNP